MEPRLYDDTHERMGSRDKKRTEISMADTGGINSVKERVCGGRRTRRRYSWMPAVAQP